MTERDLTERLFAVLKENLGGCKIDKHADSFTCGRPDFSIAYNGPTSWIELKHLEQNESVLDCLGKDQLAECVLFERATLGRAWVIAFQKGKHHGRKGSVDPSTWFFRPTYLLRNREGGLNCDGRATATLNARELWATGWQRLVGYDHMAVVKLILETHK